MRWAVAVGGELEQEADGDEGDADDEHGDVQALDGVALVRAGARTQIEAALFCRQGCGIGLAHARDEQWHTQWQHELKLLDGVLGVVLDAACGLRLHDGVHLLTKHRHKAQRRGKGEGIAIRHVQHLDAGVGKVVELG